MNRRTRSRTHPRRRSRARPNESGAVTNLRQSYRSGGGAQPGLRTDRGARASAGQAAFSPLLLRLTVCGVLFVVLVALKLLLPGPMTAVRGTLSSWLVRDADFEEAFSSVGRAVSGEKGVLGSLENAYVSVFGETEAEEVSADTVLTDEPSAKEAEEKKEIRPETEPAAEPTEEPAAEQTEEPAAEQTEEPAAEPADAPADEAAEIAAAVPEPKAADVLDYPSHASVERRVLGFDHAAPVSGTLTSPFGWREHPKTGLTTFHYGVDIGVAEGTEVDCFADGTVGVVGVSTELGNYLTVHHRNGFTTLYGHLKRASVSTGDELKLGDKVGEAGSTGNATGPHLHFELHDGEVYLDPLCYLS